MLFKSCLFLLFSALLLSCEKEQRKCICESVFEGELIQTLVVFTTDECDEYTIYTEETPSSWSCREEIEE